ncbi:hypothetical protein ACHAWF_010264 [Thalassiosira exigua]
MEQLKEANKRLKTAHDDRERDYKTELDKLDSKEEELSKRLGDLNKRKLEIAQANGNEYAADDDLVEINAGGKVITAKRCTLTQLKGTMLESLFSGRWDKKLQRDCRGRIFLDVNSACFQAIVDHLHELAISSEEDPPDTPIVDGESQSILKHYLEIFGLHNTKMLESNVIKTAYHAGCLRDWLKEDGADGKFNLLYRSSRDGLSSYEFHNHCDFKGCTLTIVETTDGYILGGYSNTPWEDPGDGDYGYNRSANKAFLFFLAGGVFPSPCKFKLKNSDDEHAVVHCEEYGPSFGSDSNPDFRVEESNVRMCLGTTYELGVFSSLKNAMSKSFQIKEMEVFQVARGSPTETTAGKGIQSEVIEIPKFIPVNTFTDPINEALNRKQECLRRAEFEVRDLEDSFNDEHNLITTFASGDVKDVMSLNVSGTMMVTKRSTLCSVEDSALAQQFDDTKWTQQGSGTADVSEWTPVDVVSWAEKIKGIQEDVVGILKKNGINGCELMALGVEGLKEIGVERTATAYLLMEEIKSLKQASSDIVTLVEHSPYCFGKILDYLRLKCLRSQGLFNRETNFACGL